MEHLGDSWFLALLALILVAAVVGWIFFNAFRVIGPVIAVIAAVVLFFGIAEYQGWINDNNGTAKASSSNQTTPTPTATATPPATPTAAATQVTRTYLDVFIDVKAGRKTVDEGKAEAKKLGATDDQIVTAVKVLGLDTQPTGTPPASTTQLGSIQSASTSTGNGGQVTTACEITPTDLEALPRSTVDTALFGSWFHPIFDQGTYQKSNGFDGQWSWAHTLCLGKSSTGGIFKNFERNDGRFVFRQDQTTASVNFAVLSTSKHKDQFLQGAKFAIAANINTMPGTTITIADGSGKVLGSQAVSSGGDLTILLPDDGVTMFNFTVVDPAGTKETAIWVGPYDRSKNINTFDASKR